MEITKIIFVTLCVVATAVKLAQGKSFDEYVWCINAAIWCII